MVGVDVALGDLAEGLGSASMQEVQAHLQTFQYCSNSTTSECALQVVRGVAGECTADELHSDALTTLPTAAELTAAQAAASSADADPVCGETAWFSKWLRAGLKKLLGTGCHYPVQELQGPLGRRAFLFFGHLHHPLRPDQQQCPVGGVLRHGHGRRWVYDLPAPR